MRALRSANEVRCGIPLSIENAVLGTEVPKTSGVAVDRVQRVNVRHFFGKAGVSDNLEEQLGLGVILKGFDPMAIVRQLGSNRAVQQG